MSLPPDPARRRGESFGLLIKPLARIWIEPRCWPRGRDLELLVTGAADVGVLRGWRREDVATRMLAALELMNWLSASGKITYDRSVLT